MNSLRQTLAALMAPLTLAGCVVAPVPLSEAAVTSSLVRSGGEQIGTVRMTAAPIGVKVRIEAAGLPPGTHGVHVHAVGRCGSRDFGSA